MQNWLCGCEDIDIFLVSPIFRQARPDFFRELSDLTPGEEVRPYRIAVHIINSTA